MTPFQQTDPSGLKLGERLTLTCAVTKGDLPLSFSWTVNDRQISSSGGAVKTVQIDPYTNLLSVDSLQPSHSGNYTCSVDNLAITTSTASHTRQQQSQLVLIQGIDYFKRGIVSQVISHCKIPHVCVFVFSALCWYSAFLFGFLKERVEFRKACWHRNLERKTKRQLIID